MSNTVPTPPAEVDGSGGPIGALVIAVPVSIILWVIVFAILWSATR